MLKIQRTADRDMLTASGRLDVDNVGELSALVAAEPAGRPLMLDLKDLVLVDRDALRFLRVCDGGTLFLDEIGEVPLEIQPKLLRILQEQTFERRSGRYSSCMTGSRWDLSTSLDRRSRSRSGSRRWRFDA